jgi:two-component system heavy metal sensor histidine kinase CusS
MRNLSHELGAGIDSIYKRELEIHAGRVSRQETMVYAERNLCQLHRYHQILENVRHMFVRRTRDTYDFRVQDLAATIREACKAFDGDAIMIDRGVVLHPPDIRGDTMLEIDSAMLRMAFFNLLQNAIKYSFDHRYIEVKGHQRRRPRSGVFEIKICNFGVGILPEEIENRTIFKEDYRGILSRDRHRTGSGLGLAIVDSIIHAHRGEVDVKSIACGDLERCRSQYAGVINEPLLTDDKRVARDRGFLNIFTVTLPYRQKEN